MKITNSLKLNITNCENAVRVSFGNGDLKKSISMADIKRKMKWKCVQVNRDGEVITNKENIKRSVRRSKVSVVDIATINKFDYFGTITINGKWHDIYNPSAILDRLLKYFNNYKSRIAKDFEYLIVPEYGEKNNRLHFHFLAFGIRKEDLFINEYNYLDWRPIRERFGHVQITEINDTQEDRLNVAKYCAKYMTKDNIQIRSHRYFCSKGLKRPNKMAVYFSSVALAALDWLEERGFKPYSHTRYEKSFVLYLQEIPAFITYLKENLRIKHMFRRFKGRLVLLPDDTPTPF